MATAAAHVDYALAYPGILPDNPLYFIKALRDRLVGFLINDFGKKAEFNLLTADKRINAAWTLAVRRRDELAISTLSKSNNYLALAIDDAKAAKSAGKNVDTVLSNLKDSIKKHEEVLLIISQKVDKSFAPQLQAEQKRLVDFGKSVEKLLPQE